MELLKYSKLFSDETERLKIVYGMDDNSVPPVPPSSKTDNDNETDNNEDSLVSKCVT